MAKIHRVLDYLTGIEAGTKRDTLQIANALNMTRDEVSISVCALVKNDVLLVDKTEKRNHRYYIDRTKHLYDWYLYKMEVPHEQATKLHTTPSS